MVLDAAFLSNNNFLLMIIVEILIFYIRKLGEKILQKKKTNLSACKAHHRYRLNKNIVIIVGLISTVTNKILHHFINKAFSIFGRDKLIFLSTQVIVILK